jgi:UDP-2,4-diacetamido-2,4,6-trideoxy-beta-L-altropyranose hydrolase
MRVAFRCDAAPAMGLGHLMRCLTLADELKRRGADCLFLVAPNTAPRRDMAGSRGFDTAVLDVEPVETVPVAADDAPMAHTVPWGWRRDAEASLRLLRPTAWDWIVVDHYGLDHRWHELIRTSGARLLAIDDMADRGVAADVVLDHNASASAERYAPRLRREARLLLGPSYALIRPGIAAFRKDPAMIGPCRRIVVTFGGASPGVHYAGVAQALATLPLRPLDVTLVGIPDSAAREAIEALSDEGFTIRAFDVVNDMPARYAAADLCIGAAGVSALERALIGIPSLTYVTADNQRQAIAALAHAGAIIDMGSIDNFSAQALVDSILRLTYTPRECERLARNGQALVPVGGPGRVADALFNTEAS